MNCTYPVERSKFASAAGFKSCGKEVDALVMTLVPLVNTNTSQTFVQEHRCCVDHACDAAVWKWSNATRIPFTVEEVDFLIKSGCEVFDLKATGLVPEGYFVEPEPNVT